MAASVKSMISAAVDDQARWALKFVARRRNRPGERTLRQK
jgi:hypothetical protein